MSKRNFVLLILALIVILVVVVGLLYLRREGTPGEDGGGTNFISDFNPFGNGKKPEPSPTEPVDIGEKPDPTPENTLKLKLISSMPIAGYGVYQKERLKDIPTPVATETPVPAPTTTKPVPPPTEFMPALRYVARENGNIYQTFADKIEERKFSSTVIPKIYEAFFGNKGESVVMRYVKGDGKTINTFVGNLPKEVLGADTTSENEVRGLFLPENITDVSISVDALRMFYLFNVGENTVGTTFEFATNKNTQVFDSAYNEWLSWFQNNNFITLTTKAASSVMGYAYTLNTSTKTFSQLLGGINGLTTLTSPDGKLVLYGDSSLSLNIYHSDTKTSDVIGLRTLPEKCVWGKGNDVVFCAVPKSIPTGSYPETWYQGGVSFADQIWKIDIASGNTTLLLDPVTISGEIDGIKLTLDEGENYLFFVNKKDSFLWEFELR